MRAILLAVLLSTGCATARGNLAWHEPEAQCVTDTECREYCLMKYGEGVNCDNAY